MYIPLSDAKRHLNIEPEFQDDDQLIIAYIQMAEDAIEHYLNRDLKECMRFGQLLPSVKAAILLQIGILYANREGVTFGKPVEVPYTIKFLVNLNRKFTV